MKQYIFRHEKALTTTFKILHILLLIFRILLILAVAISGIHYAMMHCTFPVTSEKAIDYITTFIQLWLSLVLVIFAFWILLRCIFYGNTGTEILKDYVAEILKKSVLFGLAAQTFIYCFYFCYLGNVSLASSCFWYFMIDITLENLRKMFIEKVDRAKWEQRLRCLQCLRMIAESHGKRG